MASEPIDNNSKINKKPASYGRVDDKKHTTTHHVSGRINTDPSLTVHDSVSDNQDLNNDSPSAPELENSTISNTSQADLKSLQDKLTNRGIGAFHLDDITLSNFLANTPTNTTVPNFFTCLAALLASLQQIAQKTYQSMVTMKNVETSAIQQSYQHESELMSKGAGMEFGASIAQGVGDFAQAGLSVGEARESNDAANQAQADLKTIEEQEAFEQAALKAKQNTPAPGAAGTPGAVPTTGTSGSAPAEGQGAKPEDANTTVNPRGTEEAQKKAQTDKEKEEADPVEEDEEEKDEKATGSKLPNSADLTEGQDPAGTPPPKDEGLTQAQQKVQNDAKEAAAKASKAKKTELEKTRGEALAKVTAQKREAQRRITAGAITIVAGDLKYQASMLSQVQVKQQEAIIVGQQQVQSTSQSAEQNILSFIASINEALKDALTTASSLIGSAASGMRR